MGDKREEARCREYCAWSERPLRPRSRRDARYSSPPARASSASRLSARRLCGAERGLRGDAGGVRTRPSDSASVKDRGGGERGRDEVLLQLRLSLRGADASRNYYEAG
jgi:hypothetical protein